MRIRWDHKAWTWLGAMFFIAWGVVLGFHGGQGTFGAGAIACVVGLVVVLHEVVHVGHLLAALVLGPRRCRRGWWRSRWAVRSPMPPARY